MGNKPLVMAKTRKRETNYAVGISLPCAEFDMCYKCQSAKAVDDVEAIYKLISYISHLAEINDIHPDTKGDIHEKIENYEYTLDGASDDVFDGAMKRFNTPGRHPRVSLTIALFILIVTEAKMIELTDLEHPK